jgi:hypothetical protein
MFIEGGGMKPLAIDIYCGLGGWTEGLLAEGYRVVGFDIERHRYMKRVDTQSESVKRPGLNWSDRSKRGSKDAQFNRSAEVHPDMEWIEYPAQLVLQNALTIHGAQFKDARLIVASPPCQEYSYMAMPWSLAKQREREYLDGTRDVKDLTRLFDACFRIQREACEAAGRHIPLVVENVRGAQKWVGRAKWNFGSFYLWGDVPALMPTPKREIKGFGGTWFHNKELGTINPSRNRVAPDTEAHKVPGFRFDGSGRSFQSASVEGVKSPEGYERNHPNAFGWKKPNTNSKASARKAASAQIAKIPLVLARHIASVYRQEVAT